MNGVFMKKKKIGLSLVSLCLVVGGSALFYFESLALQADNMVKAEVQQTSGASKAETGEVSKEKSTPKAETSATETSSKKVLEQRQAFSRKALAQDYYVEQVDANGKLTYVKATEEALNELQAKAKNNKLSTYQVLYKGQMIAVLAQ